MVPRRMGLSGCSLRNFSQICRASRCLPLAQSDFAQVGGDFLVGEALQRLAQQALSLVQVAQAVVHPAQAVEYGRVFRVELVGLFDQHLGFGVARGAVGQV